MKYNLRNSYQKLQHDQEAEIKSLEEEVQLMGVKHSEAIQKLKVKFLQEKKQFQDHSDTKVQAMVKKANEVRYDLEATE